MTTNGSVASITKEKANTADSVNALLQAIFDNGGLFNQTLAGLGFKQEIETALATLAAQGIDPAMAGASDG